MILEVRAPSRHLGAEPWCQQGHDPSCRSWEHWLGAHAFCRQNSAPMTMGQGPRPCTVGWGSFSAPWDRPWAPVPSRFRSVVAWVSRQALSPSGLLGYWLFHASRSLLPVLGVTLAPLPQVTQDELMAFISLTLIPSAKSFTGQWKEQKLRLRHLWGYYST